MSNRFLGILIIIGFIGIGYLYYNLYFLSEKNIDYNNNTENIIIDKKEIKLKKEETFNNVDLLTTKKEKIDKIINNKKKYKIFKIDTNTTVYFKKNKNKLDLYLNEKQIGTFDLVTSDLLKIKKIKGLKKELYIEIGKNKFIYNNITKLITKIDLNIDVLYVKNGNFNKLIFVTKKGSFIYLKNKTTLEYFSYFSDFIYKNNGYIGLVKNNEKRILKNLGFKTNDNILVYYNPYTKEKKIIYETDININQIYIENNNVYIISEIGELFKLENIKKKY